MVLRDHFHPSVAKFAQALLQRESVIYSGNPLQNFSLSNFLDRFAYKNPKRKLVEQVKQQGNTRDAHVRSSLVEEPANVRFSKDVTAKAAADEVSHFHYSSLRATRNFSSNFMH